MAKKSISISIPRYRYRFDDSLPESSCMDQLVAYISQGDNDAVRTILNKHCCRTRDNTVIAIGLHDSKSTTIVYPPVVQSTKSNQYSLLTIHKSLINNIVSFVSPTEYLSLDQSIDEHLVEENAFPDDSFLSHSLSLQGGTVLNLASLLGHSHIVTMLIGAGATVDSRTENKVTPLMMACYHCNIDTVLVLLKAGADMNAAECIQGRRPIHFAVLCSTPETGMDVIDILIQHQGNIDARDAYNKTALIIASEWNKVKMVKYLIKAGANLDLYTDSHHTAIECAALALHFECLKALLNAGAET